MIFRPVSPASPCGPPVTKRPVALTWYLIRPGSINSSGSAGPITSLTISSLICSPETSGSCWAAMTTVSIRLGVPSTYSTVTCDLPSGRR